MLKENDWSPLIDDCYVTSENDWVLVESMGDSLNKIIVENGKPLKTNLRYGKIISLCESKDWLHSVLHRNNKIILFKESMNKFCFKDPNNDEIIPCYAIKKEDIVAIFTKKVKE